MFRLGAEVESKVESVETGDGRVMQQLLGNTVSGCAEDPGCSSGPEPRCWKKQPQSSEQTQAKLVDSYKPCQALIPCHFLNRFALCF